MSACKVVEPDPQDAHGLRNLLERDLNVLNCVPSDALRAELVTLLQRERVRVGLPPHPLAACQCSRTPRTPRSPFVSASGRGKIPLPESRSARNCRAVG